MITKRSAVRLTFVLGLFILPFYDLTAQEYFNTVFTLTTDNDSARNVILKADTISVYYIHDEEEGQIHAIAVKKNDSTFLLNIRKGTVIALRGGYQNCYGSTGCFDIIEGKEINNIEIAIEAEKEIILPIRFTPPCVRNE